ncbi:hypothetical protein [Streptomyces sp. NPDC046862]
MELRLGLLHDEFPHVMVEFVVLSDRSGTVRHGHRPWCGTGTHPGA